MKKLREIFHKINPDKIIGSIDISISGIEFDSRKVASNSLFVAIKGTRSDGHEFIPMAIEKGAVAILCQFLPAFQNPGVTYIQVKDPELALGMMAAEWFDNPSQKLRLVGITGTNGKTTTATLLYKLVKQLGYKAGLLSTVINYVDEIAVPATHTTPDSLQINKLLQQMADAGCDYCFMEVSSHAIVQHRIAGLHFTGGIFTNITQDHLDYHKTFDEYIKAKKGFFDVLPSAAFSLINADDRNAKIMVQNTRSKVFTFGLKGLADYKCKLIESHFEGMQLSFNGTDLWVRLIGEFNAYNLLGIYGAAILLGFGEDEVLTHMSTLTAVDGRFQCYKSPGGKVAIIDYAHTPDAVKNVLTTISQIKSGGEQVITVVGAGGDRDKTKRPIMAAIAADMSDKVILTSDNPRSEKPEDIIHDMMAGVPLNEKKKVLVIVDRKEAIKTAMMLAHKGDVVLIAGKGHETYQEINGVKHHFDDHEVVEELFYNS